jgi:hypothetical protein
MATVMLLHERVDGSYIETRGASVRDRLAIHLRGAKLDRELAAGSSPDASVRLSLRARVLGRTATRVALARRLRQVVAEAERGPTALTTRMSVCRRKVLLARPELDALAVELLAPGAVAVEGIALTRQLLSDGSGPIYARHRAHDLAVVAVAARRALHPWPRELDDAVGR